MKPYVIRSCDNYTAHEYMTRLNESQKCNEARVYTGKLKNQPYPTFVVSVRETRSGDEVRMCCLGLQQMKSTSGPPVSPECDDCSGLK